MLDERGMDAGITRFATVDIQTGAAVAGQNITVDGGEGSDTIWGSDANETLNGGNGDDQLFGGAGVNELIGGARADEFQFTMTSKNDSVTDFNAAHTQKRRKGTRQGRHVTTWRQD